MEKENSFLKSESLDTEGGMFQSEITATISGAQELIEASTVSPELKERCNNILHKLVEESAMEPGKTDPYDLSRISLTELLSVLDQNDSEQASLFQGIKGVILQARNSAKGWKSQEI